MTPSTPDKKLNRNAFNEKILHRYIFEKYYFSQKDIRNNLLPKRFHKKDINLIVPEENTKNNYRADLSIYFKGEDTSVPVEIKWRGKDFKKENQIRYITKNKGFVIGFGHLKNPDFDYIGIDPEDFKKWVSLNISKLVGECLSQKVELSNSKQYWIVYLFGNAFMNFDRMFSMYKRTPFWAFRQNKKALKDMFNIQRGDKILFVFGMSDNRAMQDDPKKNLCIKKWCECTVKEPYYMNLSKETGNFFEEKEDLPVNKRRWPHFINFSIDSISDLGEFENMGKRGKYSTIFAKSVNYGGGVPVQINRSEYEELLDRLNTYTH